MYQLYLATRFAFVHCKPEFNTAVYKVLEMCRETDYKMRFVRSLSALSILYENNVSVCYPKHTVFTHISVRKKSTTHIFTTRRDKHIHRKPAELCSESSLVFRESNHDNNVSATVRHC